MCMVILKEEKDLRGSDMYRTKAVGSAYPNRDERTGWGGKRKGKVGTVGTDSKKSQGIRKKSQGLPGPLGKPGGSNKVGHLNTQRGNTE